MPGVIEIGLPRELLRHAIQTHGGLTPISDRELTELAPEVVCEVLRAYLAAKEAPPPVIEKKGKT